MNTKLLQILVLLLLFGFNTAFPQGKTSPREMFLEAESYFLYEEYTEAVPLYTRLAAIYPKNDNINYKLGRCYLDIPYEKEKSIALLEKASKNINPKYKDASLKETAAPIDAIFYLGDAYRVNNQIEKAIIQYKHFKEISNPDVFDHDMVTDRIRACENAQLLEKQPIKVSYSNLGDIINTRFSESNAVVSGNESTLVFLAQLTFYPAVFYAYKENGKWSAPVNINPDLEVDDDCFPVGLSYDGKELILYRNNEFLGDLYVSRFVNGKWSKIKTLNGNINTTFWESHACFSHDGRKLYFTSNRRGTNGGLDIYVSSRSDTNTDNWGEAVNLGPVVNSPLNEETPFITSDDKLFFSSLGHNGMGGYDIFTSELNKDGSWTKPQNLGFPINTTDHDLFFQPVRDGSEGYISLYKKDTNGKNDIYKVKILTPSVQLASLNQTLKEPENITPTSEIRKNIVKKDLSQNTGTQTPQLAQLTEKNKPLLITNTSLQTETKPQGPEDSIEAKQTSETKSIQTPQNKTAKDELTPGQKSAWHKMLYGGLGILAVFVFFVLSLLLRARKKNKQE